MHKISSIDPIILATHQILESHGLKGASVTFDDAQPIIVSYSKFMSPCTKLVYSIDFFMRYSQFKNPLTRVGTSIFDSAHSNIFYQSLVFSTNMKNVGYFIILF